VAKKRPSKPFVKAADTTVPVDQSVEAIKALVRRHNAAGFGVQEDYRTGRVTVSFVLNTDEGGHLPVQIPVETQIVYDRMYKQPRAAGGDRYADDPEYQQRRREQAERTAWRQLYVIVDALLTGVALGMISLTDAFLAHSMVVTDDGRSERMGDYLVRTQGVLAPGTRALLPASTTREG
jgi:hypothetical protein